MNRSRKFLIGLGAWLLASSAGATTLIKSSLQELSAKSDVVARGTVRRVQSRWTADRARIVTDVELEVTEAIKGAPARTVVIQQPGGAVGDIGQKVSGLASFEEGEDVVVFLGARPGQSFDVRGMAQGKYRVTQGADGKPVAVPEKLNETLLLDPVTRQPVAPETAAIQLDQLRAQIQAFAKTPMPSRPLPPVKTK